MLDFLPPWIKAVCGIGVVLFIFVQGFRLTSNNNNSNNNNNNNNSSNATQATPKATENKEDK